MWLTPSQNDNGGARILFTGANGDYGTTGTVITWGKANSDGNYSLAINQKGTSLVYLSHFYAVTDNTNSPPNSSNRSVPFSTSEPVEIMRGTGAMRGPADR